MNKNISKADMIFGVWNDKTASVSELIVKNSHDEVVGLVEHRWGQREYLFNVGEQKLRVELPLQWGRTIARLISEDGKVIATYERKSFSLMHHQITILNSDTLKSKRSVFGLRQPVEYLVNEKFVGMTYQISSTRNIGRIGVFSSNYPLAVKIFILICCF